MNPTVTLVRYRTLTTHELVRLRWLLTGRRSWMPTHRWAPWQ